MALLIVSFALLACAGQSSANQYAVQPESVIGFGCLHNVQVVPGERYIATCSESTVCLWHTNGTLASSLRCNGTYSFNGFAVSPHGSMLVVCDQSGKLTVIRIPDLSVVAEITYRYSAYMEPSAGGKIPNRPLSWSPDGSQIALGWCDCKVYIFNLANRTYTRTLERDAHLGDVTNVQWSHDGGMLLVSRHGTTILNASTGESLHTLADSLWSAFSPSGDLIAAVHDGWVGIHSSTNASLLGSASLEGTAVAWSSDGRHLAVGTPNGRVVVLDSSGRMVSNLSAGRQYITSLSWQGSLLACGSSDQAVRTWRMDSESGMGVPMRTFLGWATGVTSVCWFADQDLVLAGYNRDGGLRIFGPDGSLKLFVDLTGKGDVTQVAVSPDGKMIAAKVQKVTRFFHDPYDALPPGIRAGILEGSVLILDSRFGTLAGSLDLPYAHSLQWNPARPSVIAIGGLGGVKIVDASRLSEGFLASISTGDEGVGCLAWSADGGLLAVGLPSRVEIWDPWRPALVASADAWRYPYALAWSPDGSVLASLTGYDYRFDQYDLPPELEGMRHFAKLQVWRIVPAPDGFAAMILLAHALVPRDADISLAGCLSWSPDSMGVAVGTGSVDFFSLVPVPSRLGALGFPDKPGVMVWFLGPGWELVPEAYLEGPARWVSCVSWSLDGSRIVAGSNDGTIGVWVAPKLPIVEGPKQSFAAILIAVGMFVKVVASLFREGMARFSYGRDACQLSSKATSSPESHP